MLPALKIFKKFFLFSLFFILAISLFSTPTFAQTLKDYYKAPQHANYTILNLEHTLFCELAGVGIVQNQKCVVYKSDGTLAMYDKVPNGGALGGLNNMLIALYSQPPTSTAQYLADLGTNLGFIKPAHAQTVGGSGAGVIEPVLKLWQVSRNISYLAFIIVFLAVGFMIMFRQRINPQTVVSVQQALPGLVIGLILVTFSYFMAALIVDLSFVGMQLVAFLFQNSGLAGLEGASEVARNSSIFNLFWSFGGTIIGSVFGEFSRLLTPSPEFIRAIGTQPITWILNAPLAATISFIPGVAGFLSQGTGTAIGGVVSGIVILILLIALLFQMLRLIWTLVTTYITILVITIAGPLIILFASLPGKSGLLALWWKVLLANVLVFPAVFAAFLFAGAILGNTGFFQQTLPLFSGLPVDLLKSIIGIGIILGTPAVPGMVKAALGVKDIAGIPQEAAAGFATGAAPITALVGTGARTWWNTRGLGMAAEVRRRFLLARQQRRTTQEQNEPNLPPIGGQ